MKVVRNQKQQKKKKSSTKQESMKQAAYAFSEQVHNIILMSNCTKEREERKECGFTGFGLRQKRDIKQNCNNTVKKGKHRKRIQNKLNGTVVCRGIKRKIVKIYKT